MNEKAMIIQRIFNKPITSKHRRLVGYVVATKRNDNSVGIGWSLTKRGDIFNKDKGMDIATNRAFISYGDKEVVPFSIRPVVERVALRAAKMFRNCVIDVPKFKVQERVDILGKNCNCSQHDCDCSGNCGGKCY